MRSGGRVGGRADTQTVRHDEANSVFSQFFPKAPKNSSVFAGASVEHFSYAPVYHARHTSSTAAFLCDATQRRKCIRMQIRRVCAAWLLPALLPGLSTAVQLKQCSNTWLTTTIIHLPYQEPKINDVASIQPRGFLRLPLFHY
jgi:hypothetical protein